MYPLSRSAFGVDDMAGNTWEWCLNYYDFPQDAAIKIDDKTRVLRGGSWDDDPNDARASARNKFHPVGRDGDVGFRVLCSSTIE